MLDKAIQLAQSLETAEKNPEGQPLRDPVHRIRKPNTPQKIRYQAWYHRDSYSGELYLLWQAGSP